MNGVNNGNGVTNRVYRREEVLCVKGDLESEIPTILNVSKHIQTC